MIKRCQATQQGLVLNGLLLLGSVVVMSPGPRAQAVDCKEDAVQRDVARLQGTWVEVSDMIDGRPMSYRASMTFHRTWYDVESEAFAFPFVGTIVVRGAFELDPTKDPKQIRDWIVGNKASVRTGIYRFTDDGLEICYDVSRKDAVPKRFTGEKGSGQYLIKLKRKEDRGPKKERK